MTVGCTQMAMEFVHDFATTEDPDRLAWMDDAVLLLMPSINPDGQIMIIDWYEQWLGGEYEGGRMPWLYHHYVGHDNNRDFYMLTQRESLTPMAHTLAPRTHTPVRPAKFPKCWRATQDQRPCLQAASS